MKRLIFACAVCCMLGSSAWAGLVIETEVKVADAPEKSLTEAFYAEGEMTRTDMVSPGGGNSSVIFRDQIMFFLDHDKKVVQKIDKQGIDKLSRQMDEVMQQMANIPPEQRKMMEKMMQGRMPGMQKPPVRRFEKGGTAQVGPYKCNLVTMYSDEQKSQEVCLADASVEADLAEAMEAVHALARFAESLMKVARDMPFGKMFETAYQDMHQMEGFPVRTRMFNDKGEIVRESALKAITRRDIEPGTFEIPKGYKVKSLEQEIQKGR